MNIIEWTANITNVICVILGRKNSIHAWLFGIATCILFGILFFQVKLYADVALQFFFLLTCSYGWWNWRYGGKNRDPLPITFLSKTKFFQYTLFAFIIALLHGYLLYYFTDASSPFISSIMLVYSIYGQILLIGRKYQNWMVWIIVNIIAIPLYLSKGLILTAILYVLFLGNAILGLITWKKLVNKKQGKTCSPSTHPETTHPETMIES